MRITSVAVKVTTICFSKLFLANTNGEVASGKLRLAFLGDLEIFRNERKNLIKHSLSEFFMSHFATTENDHDLDAVTIFEEAFDFADFDIKVVVANLQANLHCFKLGLFFAGLFTILGFFFHLLVLVFTPVDDFDNWWIGVSRNFYQVDSLFLGDKLRVAARHDA